MRKKFETNRTKIKGGCQSWTKAAHQHSWIDLTLGTQHIPNFDFLVFHDCVGLCDACINLNNTENAGLELGIEIFTHPASAKSSIEGGQMNTTDYD